MISWYMNPYVDSSIGAASDYEAERQISYFAKHQSAMFRASQWDNIDRGDGTFGLEVGDVLLMFPVAGSDVPMSFDVTSNDAPNTFSFNLGIATNGDLITGAESFFCIVDPDGLFPIPDNQIEPLSLIRANRNRRVQTIAESLSADDNLTGIDKFRVEATSQELQVSMQVLVLPTTYNFTLHFNGVFACRNRLTTKTGREY